MQLRNIYSFKRKIEFLFYVTDIILEIVYKTIYLFNLSNLLYKFISINNLYCARARQINTKLLCRCQVLDRYWSDAVIAGYPDTRRKRERATVASLWSQDNRPDVTGRLDRSSIRSFWSMVRGICRWFWPRANSTRSKHTAVLENARSFATGMSDIV